jgi:Bacterial Ig-like domain (group 3)/FG-GAP-like repeat
MKIAVVLSIAALCVSGGANAVTRSASKVPTTRSANAHRTRTVASARFQTPFQRIIEPTLRKQLDAQKAARPSQRTAVASAMDTSVAAPNFGGFVSAPYFPGHQVNACIVSDNCGLFGVAAADFDQDGKPDLAVEQYDGTLDVLLNDGKGGFQAPAPYSNPNYLTTQLQEMVVADVNGDGYPDIVEFDDIGNDLIVFLNQKNGTFTVGPQLDLTFNYGTVGSFAIGDVNGDGKLDVVTIATNVTTPTNTFITVLTYLGNGDGSFALPTTALTNTVTLPMPVNVLIQRYGITLGDLNGDGKLDLAAVLLENTNQVVVDVAMGKGDGSFGKLNISNPINLSFPVYEPNTAGVQIADFNNDGHLDLAADADGTLYVAFGDGNGNFQAPVQTPNVLQAESIEYADVNGDGKLDMIVDSDDLEVWIGNGDGTFTLPVNGGSYVLDDDGGPSVTVADFNGDGNLDIAQGGGVYKQISLFNGNGTGQFHGAPVLSTTQDAVVAPYGDLVQAVGDFKGNGLTDFLFIDTVDANPFVGAGISDGKGNFTYTTAVSASDTANLAFIEPVQADFNGDGKQDVLYSAYSSGGLSVVLSNGDGTFQAPLALSFPATDCPLAYAAVADFDDDSKLDIAVAYPGDVSCGGSDGTVSGYFLARGKGDGTFATPVFYPFGNGLYSVTAADFNLDGIPDLILDDTPADGSGSYQISFLPGNGDGTFGLGGSVLSDYRITQVIAGDYNSDGKPDLVLLSTGEVQDQPFYQSAGIMLLPGNGDGTFGAVTQLAVGNVFSSAVVADVNGDGIPDIGALLEYTSGGSSGSEIYYGFSVLLGMGGGVFAKPVSELTPTDSAFIAAGNFFNDNAPDFLLATSEGPALYLAQGGATVSLSASAASVAFGQTETITATVAPSMTGRPAPTGTITFYDGTTLLGASSLSNGSALFSDSQLAVGTHSITAAYGGDANFNLATSAATQVAVTTLAPAFQLTPGATTLSVTQGTDGTVTLNLAANATFSGPVALTCSGAETNATCAISPAMVTLTAGSSATATLIVNTTSNVAANRNSSRLLQAPAGMLALAAMFCMFRRRRSWQRLISGICFVALLSGVLGLSGCGSSVSRIPVNVAGKGNFTVTVTATPSGTAVTAQSATVAVTVQ